MLRRAYPLRHLPRVYPQKDRLNPPVNSQKAQTLHKSQRNLKTVNTVSGGLFQVYWGVHHVQSNKVRSTLGALSELLRADGDGHR